MSLELRDTLGSVMTKEEHELMVLVLARVLRSFSALTEILKSRGIITEDDVKAFEYLVWDDPKQTLHYTNQALADYLKISKIAGVPTGLE